MLFARSALNIAASSAGEGAEEAISGAFEPALRTIYNGKSVGQNYSELEAGDLLYGALIGAALGGVGGGAEVVRTTGWNGKSPLQSPTESATVIKTDGTEGIEYGREESRDRARAIRETKGGYSESAPRASSQNEGRSGVSGELRGHKPEAGRLLHGGEKALQIEREVSSYGSAASIERAEEWTGGDVFAYTDKDGNIHIRDDVPAERVDEILGHELTHTMKRKGFEPYTKFAREAVNRVDIASDAGGKLLEKVAEHRKIDLSAPLTEDQLLVISDEICALVRGAEKSGHVEEIIGQTYADAFREIQQRMAQQDTLYSDELRRLLDELGGYREP